MTIYHINPVSGRVNICRAIIQGCPLGNDFPHFENKDEAEIFLEKLESEKYQTFPNLSKNNLIISTAHVPSRDMVENSIRNYYKDESDDYIRRNGGISNLDVHTCYGGKNAIIQLNNDDNSSFLKGCCTIWALESHRQSGLPIVTFSTNGKDIRKGNWTGHVALKIGEDEFFDAGGIGSSKSMVELFDKIYNIDSTPEIIEADELAKAIKIKVLTNKNSDELGRAMLFYKVNQLLKEYEIIR